MPSSLTFWLLFFVGTVVALIAILTIIRWNKRRKFKESDDNLKARLVGGHVNRVTGDLDNE